MTSLMHQDIANIDPKNCTPEQMEKLLNDPLMRSLQYQIQHGVKDIKLPTNTGDHKINNICVPEGEDQEAYLQKIMAEEHRNKVRAADARLPRHHTALHAFFYAQALALSSLATLCSLAIAGAQSQRGCAQEREGTRGEDCKERPMAGDGGWRWL